MSIDRVISCLLHPGVPALLGLCLLVSVVGATQGEAQSESGRAAVRKHRGMPAIFVDGRPEFPLLLFEQEICEKDAQAFSKAGFRFYSFIERASYLDMGWVGEDESNFTTIDRVLSTTHRRLPNGLFLPRIHVFAPQWWMEKHPDHTIGREWGSIDGSPGRESWASELWRQQAGEALRRMVRHILKSPYAEQVMGLTISTGSGGEWHQYGIDRTEPMRLALGDYVRRKYGDSQDRLRAAWGDPGVTFDSVTIPAEDEFLRGNLGIFRDPAHSRKVMDYYESFHSVTVDAIDHFCRIVKQESEGRLLTCVLYGYMPDMHWNTQSVHHRATAKAHRLASVDIFAGPHSYYSRGLGDHGTLRHYPESLALHGKLFIDEADDRTHLAGPRSWVVHAENLDQSLQILRRSFGNAVTSGIGMWYMDHTSGRWYDDPAIRADFERIKRWADASMDLPRDGVAEVALISAAESEFYIADKLDWTAGFYECPQGQMTDLCRSGAAFSRYTVEDLGDGLVPDHKVYLLLDCFYLTPEQRSAIEKLKSRGRTLIFYYAPGFVSHDALSLSAMQALTGLAFEQEDTGGVEVRLEPGVLAAGPRSFGHLPNPPHKDYVMRTALSPRFVPQAQEDEVWGRYADNGRPALVMRSFGDWRSVYCPAPPIPSGVLRRILSEAGVHIYMDSDDNVTANRSWVCVHTVTGGRKTIRLPEPSPVYDVISGKLVGEKLTEFEVELSPATTAIYMLGLPKSNEMSAE